MPSVIADYALIGDCETAALVNREGSIDWLCWPRFDSGACFGAMLGHPENGHWQITPTAPSKVKRQYREGTLVLETEFATPEGTVTLIDFMPLRGRNSDVVRLVRGDRGQVSMRMQLVVRFDYGRSVPWVTRQDDGSLRAIAGPDMVVLRTPVAVRGESLKTVSDFTVSEGETIPFVLTYASSFGPVPETIDPSLALEETAEWWQTWTARCTYDGPFSDVVRRSLITLKALTYRPTGGMVAAPTTSLPEEPGGPRNWDYRFCWLRDATFVLLALMHAGYDEEARDWRDWLVRAAAGSPDQLQVMYGVAGERQLMEWEVPWLCGFQNSTPVRIGNAAADQLQLDVYGEIADALHQARKAKIVPNEGTIDLESAFLEHLEKIWQDPDEGIWEVRAEKRHFTHSKVMAWVAFDRTIKSSEQLRMDGPVERWRGVRRQIHEDVCRHGFDPTMGSFVQSYGSKELDASLLMIPLVGFLPPSDPRVRGTVQAIEQRLIRDGLVMRYDTSSADDGLPAGEGAFLACSFWLADNYELLGRHAEAEQLLRRLLTLQNDVGLLAEQYHPVHRCMVGNFPQAFSHVALVNTILNLNRTVGPADQRSSSSKADPAAASAGKRN